MTGVQTCALPIYQFQADLINTVVKRPKQLETTALGAAYLAGLGVGFWEDMTSLPKTNHLELKEPITERQEQVQLAYKGWQRAIQATRLFPTN